MKAPPPQEPVLNPSSSRAAQADASNNSAMPWLKRFISDGERSSRALPTPSKAQLARHGSETRKNSNASRPIRPACPAPSPANSASAARTIIQALGLTSCNAAPPSTPRRRGGSAPSMPPALRNRLQAR